MSQEFLDAIRSGDGARVAAMLEGAPALAAARDASGVSAVLWAVYSGHPELAQAIAARRTDLDIFEAAAIGATGRVRELLAGDPELAGAYSSDGWTPLHLASFFGHPEVVDLLLEAGAPLEAKSRNTLANTPLNAAVASNRVEVARRLLEHGADPNTRQHNAVSPLHSAAFNGNLEMVKLLLAHHADPGAITEENRTAAGMAEEKGHEEVAALLRQKLAAPVS